MEPIGGSYRAHINMVGANFILTLYMNFMVRTSILGCLHAIFQKIHKNVLETPEKHEECVLHRVILCHLLPRF